MKARERRSSGLLRVPFVQRCVLEYQSGHTREAFTVNLNMLGAYVADEPLPEVGQRLTCRFRVPGNEMEIRIEGIVAWVNPQQNHPVHSLPAGFGLKFLGFGPDDASRLQEAIDDYLDRNPGSH